MSKSDQPVTNNIAAGLLVVIPAYNEEESLPIAIKDLRNHAPELDLLVINDGSKDNTLAVCHDLGLNVIDLPINLGLSGAFETGMKYAFEHNYDAVLQFDADGQHLANYIEPLRESLVEGSDVVIGSRFVDQKKHFSLRMFGSRMISLAIKLSTGKSITDPTSGMRLFGKHAIETYITSTNMTPEPDTVAYLIKKGLQVKEVHVEMRERIAGTSYLTFSHSIKYMLRMAISIIVLQGFRK